MKRKQNIFLVFFSSESGSYVVREEMERMLHVVDGKVPDTLRKCFSEGEKVNYEKFRNWLLLNNRCFYLLSLAVVWGCICDPH